MKQWYVSLAPRERVMVAAAALAAAIALIYVALWEPLAAAVVRLEQSVQTDRELKQWMQQSAAEVQRLRGAGGGAAAPGGATSLLAVADATLREAQLSPAVRRIQPEGEDVVRVVLEQAAFDDVMLWLGNLQRRGVGLADLAVDRQQPGRVSARLTLKRGGS